MTTTKMGMRTKRMDEYTYKTYRDLFKLIKDLRYTIMTGSTSTILLNRLNELLEFIRQVKTVVLG